jgi:hypothetical protein
MAIQCDDYLFDWRMRTCKRVNSSRVKVRSRFTVWIPTDIKSKSSVSCPSCAGDDQWALERVPLPSRPLLN